MGNQYNDLVRSDLADEAADTDTFLRIKSGCGFVKNKKLRFTQKCLCDKYSLFHAS